MTSLRDRFIPLAMNVPGMLRRTLTRTRLTQVADAYHRGGARAVERECAVSRSQAYRLISQARVRHHLPASDEM